MSKHDKSGDPGKAVPEAHSATGLLPFDSMEAWFDEMQKRWLSHPVFGRALPDFAGLFGGRMPKVDVIDRDNEICVRAELPGVTKEDLHVTLHDNLLGIRAKVAKEEKQEEGQYHRRELLTGEFQRTVQLPAPVDSEKVTATFKEGILELLMPKAADYRPKKIKVE